ncbi:MAG: septum formation initiator family protein [Candidatus Nealsonbacteria bacterium]|nr:septum formation initiator family protein [Candidatus Nealsonbacteria bacterium]
MIPKYKQIKKQSFQNIFFIVLISFLILIVVGFLVVSNFRINQKRAKLNAQIEQLKEEIRMAQEKKQQLQAQLYQSAQGEYLEKEARENFNLQKPGEEVVAILPQEEESQQKEKTKQWWNPLTW